MLGRGKRVLRRIVLLVPLLLTAVALLLLLRPPLPLPHELNDAPWPTADELETLLKVKSNKGNDLVGKQKEIERINMIARRPWYMKGGKRRPTPNADVKMFTDEAAHDRIENQLMYALPDDVNVSIKKIMIADGLLAFNIPNGRQEFLRNKCPVSECMVTEPNADEAATADAILYKDRLTDFNVKRPPNQIWILYLLECCQYHPAMYQSRSFAVDPYNWTATYRRDSDIVAPYEKWVYHDPLVTQRDQEINYAANKTGKVAMFVSNCDARNRRLEYAKHLSKYISVDIYGACGNKSCPKIDPNCLALLDNKYKFYLAFENANSKDYITEKFFVNGLQHNSVPIVMGARPEDYEASAPYYSYIHVENFKGPKELAAYLKKLDKDDILYNEYFRWKGTGEFINTYFFCRLCAMLHATELKERNSFYKDI